MQIDKSLWGKTTQSNRQGRTSYNYCKINFILLLSSIGLHLFTKVLFFFIVLKCWLALKNNLFVSLNLYKILLN